MKPAPSANKQPFLSDVKTLRDRARQHIEEGAVTAGYGGDTAVAVKVLNAALATEQPPTSAANIRSERGDI